MVLFAPRIAHNLTTICVRPCAIIFRVASPQCRALSNTSRRVFAFTNNRTPYHPKVQVNLNRFKSTQSKPRLQPRPLSRPQPKSNPRPENTSPGTYRFDATREGPRSKVEEFLSESKKQARQSKSTQDFVKLFIIVNTAVLALLYSFGDMSNIQAEIDGLVLKINSPWYTWFTSAFLHMDIYHLGFNMLAAYLLGVQILSMMPGMRVAHMAILMLGSSIGCSYFQLRYSPHAADGRALGASGIATGMLGAAAILAPRQKLYLVGFIPVPFWAILVAFSAWESYWALSEEGALPVPLSPPEESRIVGHWGHLGGAVFGVLYGLLMRRMGVKALSRGHSLG